ncbi:MAG: serine/threonine protein kinase [bacterium]|nr:serine/threonine protein kinase [bacterium]
MTQSNLRGGHSQNSATPTHSLVPVSSTDPELQIHGFRVLQRIGEGGMGEVYIAEQMQPIRRKVALKIIKRGLDSQEVVARFENERQALAMMDHQNIAKVFEAGTTERGRPFFVMEYVQGVAITEHCDRHRLSNHDRLELFARVCEGVQHAHQKAIIHRDIKPSNVLVTVQDGQAVPKIIDFGVAKATAQRLTERTMFTEFGQIIGTPEYMSPEQAEMTGQDIDTRTDIYSLGVLLYELLVGELPFNSEELRSLDSDSVRRKIREEDPPKPSSRVSMLTAESEKIGTNRQTDLGGLARQLRGDLDWIVLKALEKDRTRRYESAYGFAADVRRHLANQPVVASPPSTAYRFRKFVKRHRAGVITTATAAAALLAGLALAIFGFVNASHERDHKEAALAEAKTVTEFLAGMLAAVDPSAKGRDVTVRQVLDEASEQISPALTGQPLAEAHLRHTIGSSYLGLGLHAEAERHLPLAVELRSQYLGSQHSETLVSIDRLASLYLAQGRFQEAEAKYASLLAIRITMLGRQHRDAQWAAFGLANVFFQQGRFEEAEVIYQTALSVFRSSLGADHEDTLWAMFNLASCHWAKGEYGTAEPLYLRVLEGRTATLGTEHPDTIDAMNNLAALYHVQGRFVAAEQLYSQALEVGTRVRGAEHPETLVLLGNLGELRADQGRNDEARALLTQVIELKSRVLGVEHPSTTYSAEILARLDDA